MGLTALNVRCVIDRIGEAIEKNRQFLTELDSAIGDADHGINMDKGFRAVRLKLESASTEDVGAILKTAGMALVSNVGGAAGPLYGTAFMKAGAVVSGKKEINIQDFVHMLEAAIEGIKMRGKAELGDKTMIDALEPAAEAIRRAVSDGLEPLDALEKAREAAGLGVDKTKGIEARKGRASYLGPRSIGHQDPGATSSYLILDTIYEAVKELKA